MVHSTEQGLKLQLLAAALIAALAFLHYLLWIDENGMRQAQTLRIGIQAQTEENVELAERNRALVAEIADLKRGLMAIEERARSDMGMIRPDETFYRLLEKPLSSSEAPNKATPPAKSALSANPPTPVAKRSTPAAKLAAPTTKPPRPAAKPASAAKPPTLAAKPKPAPAIKPPTPAAKPKPVAKPPAQATKPATKPAPVPGASQRRE